MPKPRAPSRKDGIGIPLFGMHWYGDPSDGTSIIAYCGGGGSAATGVKNKLFIEIAGRHDDDDASNNNQEDSQGGKKEDEEDEPIILETLDLGLAINIVKNPITNKITLFCAVGNKINVYSLPEARLEQELDIGASANAIAVNSMADTIALGCENGSIKVYDIEHDYKVNELPSYVCDEGPDVGHIKAVCAVAFAPREKDMIVSSSKDGTARVWKRDECIGVLKCTVTDPRGPPPKKPQKFIVVRGCAFGDLEGKVVYTVASGKRGSAFLSKWAFDETKNQFECFDRTVCSDHPVSAMSMSSDATALALGNSEGSVLLFNILKWKPIKTFLNVHDFPVTCIAARPYEVPLKGEDKSMIRFNAVSASADAQLARLTTQRRVPKSGSSRSAGFPLAEYVNKSIKWVLLLWILSVLAQDVWEECGDENGGIGAKLLCVRDNVLIAPSSRPGISVPPH